MLGFILVVFLGVVVYQWRWKKGLVVVGDVQVRDTAGEEGLGVLGVARGEEEGKDGDGSSGLSGLSRSEEGSVKVEELDKGEEKEKEKEKENENEGDGVKVLGD